MFDNELLKQANLSDNRLLKELGTLLFLNLLFQLPKRNLFLNQLEFYLENSRNPQVQSDLFLVEEWDEAVGEYNLVRYRRPSTNLRVLIRSKRGGNQYMLMGANRIRFELAENGWLIVTNSFDGVKEFEGRIWVKSWIEEHLE